MIILGFGSNLGKRADYLAAALWKVSLFFENIYPSPVYESRALQAPSRKDELMPDFLNMVACGNSMMPPKQLLSEVKLIEEELGRKDRGVWGSREIDIDILVYNNLLMMDDTLTIPHPHMLARDFVMVPLADAAPEWTYPGKGPYQGKTAAQINKAKGYKENAGLRKTDIGML